jgi:hypothetical protein
MLVNIYNNKHKIIVDIHELESIYSLKTKIFNDLNKINSHHIKYNGRILLNDKSISYHNITDKSLLYIERKIVGGEIKQTDILTFFFRNGIYFGILFLLIFGMFFGIMPIISKWLYAALYTVKDTIFSKMDLNISAKIGMQKYALIFLKFLLNIFIVIGLFFIKYMLQAIIIYLLVTFLVYRSILSRTKNNCTAIDNAQYIGRIVATVYFILYAIMQLSPFKPFIELFNILPDCISVYFVPIKIMFLKMEDKFGAKLLRNLKTIFLLPNPTYYTGELVTSIITKIYNVGSGKTSGYGIPMYDNLMIKIYSFLTIYGSKRVEEALPYMLDGNFASFFTIITFFVMLSYYITKSMI